jgi:hypothetical protein
MNIIRIFAISIASAGAIAGAAVGLAGTAGATTIGNDVRPPHVVATPEIRARPAPQIMPGAHWHHGIYRQAVLAPGSSF